MADFYIGKRLSYDGQLCTVRYYGEVAGTKGKWLGVEWDDPTRGKHSGEHAGTKYFECLSKQPTAASFVRSTRKPDAPRTFIEALKAKYASEDFEEPGVRIVFATGPGDSAAKKKDPLARINQPIRIKGKEVEEVGFDKIRRQLAELSELKIVILDGLCMERPEARLKDGADGWAEGLTDVKEACPKAKELDLSRNLFEEWREVASICEQLEKVWSLRVDGNRFRDTSLTDAETVRAQKAFANVKYLKLESTLLPWEDLTRLTHTFPSLTTLVASSNLYTTLPHHIPTPHLTDLSLEDNLLTSIADLHPLTSLPYLRRLVLKSNEISSITPDTSTTPPPTSDLIFSPTLTHLDLSYNAISTWPLLDALPTHFPGLTSLRISHNPLYTHLSAPDDGKPLTPEDGYMLTLARLAPITTLNFSPVAPKERLNAETYYLSLIARELGAAPEADAAAIIATHPRYAALCEEYGEPRVERGEGSVNPNALAGRLVRVRMYCVEGGQRREAEVEIPRGYSAYTLLGMVSRAFGVRPRMCRLVWETGDWVPVVRGAGDNAWEEESESDGEEDGEEGARRAGKMAMREVEIVPGTRAVGTWIEGREATVRVEIK